jgi:hypothetical protein
MSLDSMGPYCLSGGELYLIILVPHTKDSELPVQHQHLFCINNYVDIHFHTLSKMH